RRRDGVAAQLHVRARLPRPAHGARPAAGADDHQADRRSPPRARRVARRRYGLRGGHDRPLRARVRGGALMPLLKEASVDAVKAAADIVSVVEGRVRLRKAGATYKGLCPFHQERTPSFVVTPARGTYHCFGCQRGGDAISFVREAEQLDFVGAIEWLAERFGIELEYEE